MQLNNSIQSKALIWNTLSPMLLIMTVRLVLVRLSDVLLGHARGFDSSPSVQLLGVVDSTMLMPRRIWLRDALSFHWATLCVRPYYQHTTQLGLKLDLVAVTRAPLVSLCAEHGNGLLWEKSQPSESKVLTIALQPAATNCSAAHLAPC